MDNIVKGWLRKFDNCSKYALFSAIVAGFLAHAYMLFNKISFLDDNTYYFDVGETFASGRWALGLIKSIQEWIGISNYSMPYWNGLCSILFIALMAVILVKLMDVKSNVYAILMGTIMTVFPVVTSTFAYMFTAPYYFFAGFCLVLAVYICVNYKKMWIVSILLISFALGIYQAYFGVATGILVLYLIQNLPESTFVDNVKQAVKYFFVLCGGLALYFVCNKISLIVSRTQLGSYQGISDMTDVGVQDLCEGVLDAYKMFLQLLVADVEGLSNGTLIQILYVGIYLLTFGCFFLMFRRLKGNLKNQIFLLILVVMAPLSLTIICVMIAAGDAYVHTLMVYSLVLIPIYPLVLLSKIERSTDCGRNGWETKCSKTLGVVTCVVVFCMSIFYIRLDNAAYLKISYQQENAIAYYTTLLGNMKGTEGYSDELPVLFVGNPDGMDSSIGKIREFDNITLQGYNTDMNVFISYYANVCFMERHCGYTYREPGNALELKQADEVKKMPCYPEYGAISVVDGVVVVKFSEE